MQRNSCTFNQYRLSPVEDFSVFAGFSCLKPEDTDRDLDDFIHNDAERHFKDRIAITYSLISSAYPEFILGFATLQNDAIVIPDQPPAAFPLSKQYEYRAFPAVKIGRLGIQNELQYNGAGSALIHMIKMLMTTANRTGCRFLTVDARRDKRNKINVCPFYAKNGFSELTLRNKTSRYIPMYFDLATFCINNS